MFYILAPAQKLKTLIQALNKTHKLCRIHKVYFKKLLKTNHTGILIYLKSFFPRLKENTLATSSRHRLYKSKTSR